MVIGIYSKAKRKASAYARALRRRPIRGVVQRSISSEIAIETRERHSRCTAGFVEDEKA